MKIYWKDIEEMGNGWAGLAVNVETDESVKPVFHIQTGENGRIKLVNDNAVIFWATIVKDYCGVWLVKSFLNSEIRNMPISPIRSSDIESRSNLTGGEWLKSWNRFYIDELAKSRASFLYSGLWLFGACSSKETPNRWEYKPVVRSHYIDNSCIYEVKESLKHEEVEWIDWWLNGSCKLINVKIPDPESGRVKWWRKKVKAGRLPPILVWYLNCLDAYIIIDGHDRLLASVMEDTPPEFIVAYSAEEIEVSLDKEVQKRIVDSVENRNALKRKKPIPDDRVNEILIQAFDDRPITRSKTLGWATIDSNQRWVSEVLDYLGGIGKSEFADAVISREG